MKKIDHYSGFEGESGIQFTGKSGDTIKSILHISIRYFDPIMSCAKSGPNGWAGFAYKYHVDESWGDSPFNISNLDQAIKEFTELNVTKLEEVEKLVWKDLCHFLTDAKENDESVWIIYS